MIGLERNYPQHLKVNAISLVYQGLSAEDICERLSIHDPELVYEWNKDTDLVQLAISTGQIDVLQSQMRAKLVRNANILLDAGMEPEKLKKASSLQLITAAGICLQKLMDYDNRGQGQVPLTQVNVNISNSRDAIEVMTAEEIAIKKEMAVLEAEIESTKSFVELERDTREIFNGI